jgi:hypothetical protein
MESSHQAWSMRFVRFRMTEASGSDQNRDLNLYGLKCGITFSAKRRMELTIL